jgi:hypothetical protein
MNPEAAQRNAMRPVLLTGSPNELTLDTSELSPKVVVDKITEHIAQVRANV